MSLMHFLQVFQRNTLLALSISLLDPVETQLRCTAQIDDSL
jgi:hypothetical protein